MSRVVTLEFYREAFSFNAAHFTLFSATERERLHGHNYFVAASVTARINEPGITFDYALFKEKLILLCKQLDKYLLLPRRSPYLKIQLQNEYYEVIFHRDKMFFLRKDVLLLPIENVTLEALSQWFIDQLVEDQNFIQRYHIKAIALKVFNGSTQSARADWAL